MYLSGVNLTAVGECHRRVVLVHYLARYPANDGRVDMVAEWHFFRECTDAGITNGTVDVLRLRLIACRQLEGG